MKNFIYMIAGAILAFTVAGCAVYEQPPTYSPVVGSRQPRSLTGVSNDTIRNIRQRSLWGMYHTSSQEER